MVVNSDAIEQLDKLWPPAGHRRAGDVVGGWCVMEAAKSRGQVMGVGGTSDDN
jgi:hypothetical protein